MIWGAGRCTEVEAEIEQRNGPKSIEREGGCGQASRVSKGSNIQAMGGSKSRFVEYGVGERHQSWPPQFHH